MDSRMKKSAQLIGKLHTMPWLKTVSPTHSRAQLAVGPGGEVLSMKKTNEDYFPGTREEKKVMEKKGKKGKTVLTLDTLEELMSTASVSPDLEEEPNPCSNSLNIDENSSQMTVAGAAVWSKEEGTADKLFPDLQAVVKDRNKKAEMLIEALVESFATLQLDSFRKPTIPEKNQWEAVPDEDEGGRENVRRNLPSPLKHEPPSSADENDASARPGIFRNKQNSFNRCLVEPESLDFGFRKRSESLEEEIKAGRSLKSVSFGETLLAEDPSGTSSRNDESEKIVDGGQAREPNIDKYGRVDGYSGSRLFLGQGARIKELQYIQSKNNVATQDNEQPESEASVAMQPLQDVLKFEKRLTTAVEEPTNSVDDPEKPFTEVEMPTTVLDKPSQELQQNIPEPLTNTEILVTPPPVQDVREPEEEPLTVAGMPRTTEPEIPTIEVEAEKPTTGMEILDSKEAAPAPVQEICQLTGMPMTRVETSENQSQPMRESDLDVDLIIRPGVQDVRYMKKDPTFVVREANRPRPGKSCRLWSLDPRKEKKSKKLKTQVENQPEKSRKLKDLNNNRNSIERPDKLKVEAPLWSNSKESFVSLQSKTTAPKMSKLKNSRTKHETTREEPATTFQMMLNNRRVEMVSCGTQTAGNCAPENEPEIRYINAPYSPYNYPLSQMPVVYQQQSPGVGMILGYQFVNL